MSAGATTPVISFESKKHDFGTINLIKDSMVPGFNSFALRLEYCPPVMKAWTSYQVKKSFDSYLFDELKLPPAAADEAYIGLKDSLTFMSGQIKDSLKKVSVDSAMAALHAVFIRFGRAEKDLAERYKDRKAEYEEKYSCIPAS
jgi:hypothetical protein